MLYPYGQLGVLRVDRTKSGHSHGMSTMSYIQPFVFCAEVPSDGVDTVLQCKETVMVGPLPTSLVVSIRIVYWTGHSSQSLLDKIIAS